MDDSQKEDMMDLKEEAPHDGYQALSQLTFGASIPGEEIITDDIPTQETAMPIPLKLLEVATGKEVHYKNEFAVAEMEAFSEPLQEAAMPVPLKLVEVSTGIEVQYRPNFGVPYSGEGGDPLQMDLMAVKEEPPDDDFDAENEESFMSVKQEPEESFTGGNFADEVSYSPLHLAQTSFGSDNYPQMGFSLQKWKWKMSKILGNDLNETEEFKEEEEEALTEGQEETDEVEKAKRERLKRSRLEYQARKQKEKSEQQANLIARITEHIHLKRLGESEEERQERLRNTKTYAARRSSNKAWKYVLTDKGDGMTSVAFEETEEERERRLDLQRLRQAKFRAKETPEEKQRRLEKARLRTQKYRLKETPEKKEERRKKMRLYVAMKRLRKGEEEGSTPWRGAAEEESESGSLGSSLATGSRSASVASEETGGEFSGGGMVSESGRYDELGGKAVQGESRSEEDGQKLLTEEAEEGRSEGKEYVSMYEAMNDDLGDDDDSDVGSERSSVFTTTSEGMSSIVTTMSEGKSGIVTTTTSEEKPLIVREMNRYRRYIEDLRMEKGIVCETPEHRDKRLEQERLRTRQRRLQETEEEREKRRRNMRLYKRLKRLKKGEENNEDDEAETTTTVAADDGEGSECSSRRTSMEMLPEMERAELEALMQARRIVRETPEERDRRLERNRIRLREKRHSRVQDCREREREYKRMYRRKNLENAAGEEGFKEGGGEEEEVMLSADTDEVVMNELEVMERLSRSIVPETEEQRKRRLNLDRERKAEKRANETSEERSSRLEKMRCYWKERKERDAVLGKDPEKERLRSLKNCRRAKMKREMETPEERRKRLEGLRAAQRKYLAKETQEQREKRLLNLKLLQARRMANETTEQKEKRLRRGREYYARRHSKNKEVEETEVTGGSQGEEESKGEAAVEGEQ